MTRPILSVVVGEEATKVPDDRERAAWSQHISLIAALQKPRRLRTVLEQRARARNRQERPKSHEILSKVVTMTKMERNGRRLLERAVIPRKTLVTIMGKRQKIQMVNLQLKRKGGGRYLPRKISQKTKFGMQIPMAQKRMLKAIDSPSEGGCSHFQMMTADKRAIACHSILMFNFFLIFGFLFITGLEMPNSTESFCARDLARL